MIDHRGHDHDTDEPDECPWCMERTPAPSAHRCLPIGWAMHCDATDEELLMLAAIHEAQAAAIPTVNAAITRAIELNDRQEPA